MAYAMMNNATDWIPAVRHKRSQNAGVAYGLADTTAAVLDALMVIGSSGVALLALSICLALPVLEPGACRCIHCTLVSVFVRTGFSQSRLRYRRGGRSSWSGDAS